jgi:oxygen-dependent protoporphyrinogen oxidase
LIGTFNPQQRQVTVVGAGISGLLLAEALDRAGWEVTLIEAARDPGGLIETRRLERGVAETAAHSLLATPPVIELCERLGVELVPVRPESRARYVWRGGRLRKFPLSVWETLKLFARAYLVTAAPGDPARRTLDEWALKHLGKPALDYLLTPFVRGIYGCRPSELEVGMVFPRLAVPPGHSLVSLMIHRWQRRLRGLPDDTAVSPATAPSRRRARPRMMAPRGGMQALTDALARKLRERLGDRYRLGRSFEPLSAYEGNLALCVPAGEAARLLAPADPVLAQALTRVPYTPLVTVTAFVERRAFPEPPRGVGVLLPEGTSRRALGVLFNSSAFEGRVADPAEWVSLTVMLGGSARPEQGSESDDEIAAHVRRDLEAIFDLAPGARIETAIRRWARAVPQYGAPLREAWGQARSGWCAQPGRVLFGNYTGQVSIRGMIETAAELAPAASAQLH